MSKSWSVLYDDKVYDIYITRGSVKRFSQSRVYLVRPGEKIYLGDVLRETGALTPNWWAFGHPEKMHNMEGFATRRHAIEYMLKAQSYWRYTDDGWDRFLGGWNARLKGTT